MRESTNGVSRSEQSASIIIPTFNGGSRIVRCLDVLSEQIAGCDVEVLVVDDGSTDNTRDVVERYASVRLIRQANAGPASARNRGAMEARGEILLFTDDDCVPLPGWLDAMFQPFQEAEVVGAKGIYRTLQKSLIARFVQLEYEDKYRLMADLPTIDFIDTYSAAFRRERFLEMGGYDTSFPVACAEDVELSYRMSARGWKMKFAPSAVVYHTHPDTLSKYLKKKYKFAYWRVLAVRKNPGKAVKDSHTPQTMKFQLLFAPALVMAAIFDLIVRPSLPLSAGVLAGFLLTTLPFAVRSIKKDPVVGLLSPFLLATRACSQMFGVAAGLINAGRKPAAMTVTSSK
jgi:GT2 family glycosyltransferase